MTNITKSLDQFHALSELVNTFFNFNLINRVQRRNIKTYYYFQLNPL